MQGLMDLLRSDVCLTTFETPASLRELSKPEKTVVGRWQHCCRSTTVPSIHHRHSILKLKGCHKSDGPHALQIPPEARHCFTSGRSGEG